MNGKQFADKYSRQDYESMAWDIAKTLTIRTYDETGSHDTIRDTTSIEENIIAEIAVGAMNTFGYCGEDADASTICNMAEFVLMRFMPEVNTYDTIYIPLMKCFEQW